LITDLEIGGTPTVVRELAVRLRDPPDIDVEVACLSKWGPVADELRDAGVTVTALGASNVAGAIGTTVGLARLINAHHIDTVLSFLMHANTVAAAASQFCRKTRFYQSVQTTQPNPRWHWRTQSLAQHAAKRVVVPSESCADAAHVWAHVPREKIVVIPNAIDPDEFQRSRVPVEPPQPPEDYPVGFIGRLDAVKRVPKLLRALKSLGQTFPSPVHLHIYGEGNERAHIESEIARLHMTDHVTLHGAVDRPHDALTKIGLLVLPSLAEGFGLVLIEAMAAGVPVVATDVPGIRDVVRDEETGLLVDAEHELELAFAMMRVIEDERLRHRLIENGIREVHERFSWPSVIGQYVQVLGLRR
jgi:glycosyltransferase involved in cell wall biosynthesis